jgi:hypothetical protein
VAHGIGAPLVLVVVLVVVLLLVVVTCPLDAALLEDALLVVTAPVPALDELPDVPFPPAPVVELVVPPPVVATLEPHPTPSTSTPAT